MTAGCVSYSGEQRLQIPSFVQYGACPLCAVHGRQQLIQRYRHYLRPDNLSRAIPPLVDRRDPGRPSDSCSIRSQRCRGCLVVCTSQKQATEAGGFNLVSWVFRYIVKYHFQTDIWRASEKLQMDLQLWSQPAFGPRANLTDVRKWHPMDQSGGDGADQSNANRCSSTSSSVTFAFNPVWRRTHHGAGG